MKTVDIRLTNVSMCLCNPFLLNNLSCMRDIFTKHRLYVLYVGDPARDLFWIN